MQDNPSVVLKGVRSIAFEERPIPQLKDPHYVKIAIKKPGICGSDFAYYATGACGSFQVKKPMVLGHESSGVITEIGSAVRTLKVGDRVACEPGVPSRYSYEYKSGHYNLCPHMAFAATPPYDGTLCRYYVLPEDFCVKLPETVSFEEGALVEPLSVAVHANKRAETHCGDRLLVMGAGPVGLLIAGAGRAFGAIKVIIVDRVQSRLEFAVENGFATDYFNSENKSADDLAEYIKGKWSGESPTTVIDATGAPVCIRAALHVISKGGRYVQVGNGKITLDKFPIARISENEINIRGSFRYGVNDYKTAVDLIATKKINVKPLITHRFSFAQAIDAYKSFSQHKAIKIMISGPDSLRSKL